MTRLLLALALLAIGFGAGLGVGLLTTPEPHGRTIRSVTTRVEIVSASRRASRIPAPIPTLVEGSLDPRGLALSSAVPADANLDGANYVEGKPSQLIVTWDREHLTRDGQAAIWESRGIAIWQLDRGNGAVWHRVYTFETPLNDMLGVEGFRVSLGDISGDRRPEILVFFDTGGSAGNGTYHLFANSGYRIRQPLVKELSSDDGTISFAHGTLVIDQGVTYLGPGIHCCYRNVRETRLRWDGRRLVTVQHTVRKNRRQWPPG